MESKNKIQAIAEQIETKLIESDKVKDELHSISREIIKFSGQSIEGLHRKDINQAKEKLVSIENLLIQLNKYLMKESHYKYTGIVNVALQEYVEAKLFYFTILNKPFPTVEELAVTEQAYLLGVADLIGELRRFILELLVENSLEDAKNYYEFMKELYATFLQIEIGKNIVSDFRRKKDTARVLVERTLSDLFVALQSKKLENKLKAKNDQE
ncbi:MAG: haloacid dehalogenase [Candidatus Heimdallarchaeaceae archaeon]